MAFDDNLNKSICGYFIEEGISGNEGKNSGGETELG